jgi:hypothetical protein
MFGIEPKPLTTLVLPFDVIKNFETDEELEDITVTYEPVTATLYYSRSNLWAFDGNYCLEFGIDVDRWVVYLEIPFDVTKYKEINLYVKAIEDIDNMGIDFWFHNKVSNDWSNFSVFDGSLYKETMSKLMFKKETYEEIGRNWSDIDGFKIEFRYGGGGSTYRNNEEYWLIQIDYLIAKKL